MTIKTSNTDGAVTVKLSGRLDSTTAGDFEEALKPLITDELRSLSIDLGEVDYVSSKGIRVLVAAYKQMNGREMALLSPNPSVKELLKMSGLLSIFTIK